MVTSRVRHITIAMIQRPSLQVGASFCWVAVVSSALKLLQTVGEVMACTRQRFELDCSAVCASGLITNVT